MHKKNKRIEEILNCISHGLGIVFGIVALTVLLIISIRKKDPTSIAAFSIYGACIIFMFLSSTLYHGLTKKRVKEVLRVFDHSAIFLFIAGTYTPIVILTLTGKFRIFMLVAVWSIAIAGVLFKILTFGKFDKYTVLSLVIYIGMGWIALIPIKAIINVTSINFFYWILAGGILYTLGTIFYKNKKIPFNHAIWHMFVLAASITHFFGIMIYLA